MDDDDEHSGGGTLVIDPTAAQNARAGRVVDESTSALDPGAPGPRPHDNGPMATQVLPLTAEPGPHHGAPRPAAGVPAVNKAATMPLPPSSSPPTVGLSPLDFLPPGGSGPLPPMPPQMPPPAPAADARPSYSSLPKPLPERPMMSDASTVVSPERKKSRAIFVVLGVLVVGALGALGFVLYTRMQTGGASASASSTKPKEATATAPATTPPPTATSTTVASTTPAPSTSPTASTAATVASAPPTASVPASAPPSATTASQSSTPEASAIAALGRLRDGLDRCVKSTAHVLPPTSPLLPDSLTRLRSGPYTTTPRDYLPAFFSCTQFRAEGPMSFAIQWQLQIPSWLGVAVAWIDTNGDGTADKAYAFTARLKERDVVEYGDVSPIDVGKIPPMPR